jgi:hypothetical protein
MGHVSLEVSIDAADGLWFDAVLVKSTGCNQRVVQRVRTSASAVVPLARWNSQSARIVGLETGVFERAGAIKVTRWNAVLSILDAAYPDTRSAIELYT